MENMKHGTQNMEHHQSGKEKEGGRYHERLLELLNRYAHSVFRLTRRFPKEELYGVISQLRRAALSIVLNYIEGYARQRVAVYKNFLEISYGSLKESSYLTAFSRDEGWLTNTEHTELQVLEKEIGAMLWGILRKM